MTEPTACSGTTNSGREESLGGMGSHKYPAGLPCAGGGTGGPVGELSTVGHGWCTSVVRFPQVTISLTCALSGSPGFAGGTSLGRNSAPAPDGIMSMAQSRFIGFHPLFFCPNVKESSGPIRALGPFSLSNGGILAFRFFEINE